MFYVYNLNEKENTGNFEKLYSTCINILSGLNDAFNGALDDADNVEQYLSGLRVRLSLCMRTGFIWNRCMIR